MQQMLSRLMVRKIYLIFVVLIIQQSSPLWALVDQNDSLFYQLGFEQELNAYQWLSQIYYNRPVLGNGLLRVGENFNSSLIRLSRDDRNWI